MMSPEEILQMTTQPAVDAIVDYGRRIGAKKDLADQRAYEKKLVEDAREYERQKSERDRENRKADEAEAYKRQLLRDAAAVGVSVEGKDLQQIAYELNEVKKDNRIDEKRVELDLENKATAAKTEQALRLEAKKLEVPNSESIPIEELQVAVEKAAAASSDRRAKQRSQILANPNDEQRATVEQFNLLRQRLGRELAKYAGASMSAPDLAPEDEKQIAAAAWAEVVKNPLLSKDIKDLQAAAMKNPNIQASLQRVAAGQGLPRDYTNIPPQIAAELTAAHAEAKNSYYRLMAPQLRNSGIIARQDMTLNIQMLKSELDRLRSKHDYLGDMPLLDLNEGSSAGSTSGGTGRPPLPGESPSDSGSSASKIGAAGAAAINGEMPGGFPVVGARLSYKEPMGGRPMPDVHPMNAPGAVRDEYGSALSEFVSRSGELQSDMRAAPRGEEAILAPLFQSIAQNSRVEPQRYLGYRFYKKPENIVADDRENYLSQFDRLPQEAKMRMLIDAIDSSYQDPARRLSSMPGFDSTGLFK